MTLLRFPAFAIGLFSAIPAAAAIDVDTQPREVTVFPQTARVVRAGSKHLPSGAVTVAFSDLPTTADDSSLRLSVAGPKGTKFFGAEIRNRATAEIVEKRTRELQDQIRVLEDQKTDVADRTNARNAEIDILKDLSKQSAGRVGEQSATRPVELAGLANAVGAVGQKIGALYAENRKDERATRALDEKINALRQEVSKVGGGNREKKTAEADLELASEGDVDFTLSYQLSGAGWSPIYDARLQGDGDAVKVALAFAAQVRQQTGEDWNDVKLVLSTAQPTAGSQLPDPTNWWLDYRPRYRAMGRAAMMDYAPAAAPMARREPVQAEEKQEAEIENAATERAEYATQFSVARAATIPSDGSAHRVAVAQTTYDASLLLATVPRLSPAAYIQATVKYSGDQPLLPGQVQLFRGDDFAGTTTLRAVAPGETFDLGFGQDENVKVERKLMVEQSKGASLFTKAGRRYRWVTTIKNFHTGKRAIEVREQLPRSRQKEIVVETAELSPTPLPEDSERPGLQRWRLDLEPKGEAKVVFAYSVKYPEGSDVVGLE